MKKILDFLKKIRLSHSSNNNCTKSSCKSDKKNTNDFRIQIGDKKYSKTTLKLGLWLFALIGIIILVISLILLGFILVFLIIFLLWTWFAFWVKQKIDNEKLKDRKIFTIFMLVMVFTITLILVGILIN